MGSGGTVERFSLTTKRGPGKLLARPHGRDRRRRGTLQLGSIFGGFSAVAPVGGARSVPPRAGALAKPVLLALAVTAVLAFPAVLGCNVLAVLVAGPSRPRKAAAVALGVLAFVFAALFPPPLAPLRGWLWLAAAMLWMRVVDVLSIAQEPAPARLEQLLLVYDPRDMRPAPPRFAGELVAKALGYGVLAVAALAFAAFATAHGSLAGRWLGGGLHFYAVLECADGGFRALYAAMGRRALPMQDQPYRARTLAELWGRRWNREVGRWIHRWCFRPLARRGHPGLGVLAGFGWSALFHGAAAWAAVDLTAGLVMASFFVAHGAAMVVERALGVARWPAWAGHAWVVGVFVVTVPLFAEPLVQLMGIGAG